MASKTHDFSNVHRLSRRLSRKKIGPKRRVFGRFYAQRLNVQEWHDALVKIGSEGGQQALKIDFEAEQKSIEEQTDIFAITFLLRDIEYWQNIAP